ncbi:MAG: ATP-dependent helicase [Candidatus Omnitrophica bacterium]|nr:ATP-dependent helicase [Candidatus Omnitrophota bacterium]
MKDYMRFYEQLNNQQKLAVDTIHGPLLVLAGPGTGKTQLLSVRAASILFNTDAKPENILILTYTNSASKAMKERLGMIVGPQGYDIEVGTFHSFANSILQGSAEAANYVGEKIPINEVEQAKAVQYILDNTDSLDEIRPFRAPYTYLKEILKKISDLKKDGITPSDLEEYLQKKDAYYRSMEYRYVKRLLAFSIVYSRYEEIKTGKTKGVFDERGRYDFDDMILYATEALKHEEPLRRECQNLYQYIMVDEYQDTNGAQLELLFTLLDYKRPNICCVGDDDQSIYRFQGASIANFRLIEEKFPEIKKISLVDNYRSSDDLIGASKKIIELIPIGERVQDKPLKGVRRPTTKEISYKEFSTEEEELLYIVDKVKELKERIANDPSLSDDERSHPYNNITILVRKREQILKIIDAFLRAGIPYATDGKEDISSEPRVMQLLDVLELAKADPKDSESKDLALYKVLSADYLHIPQADILRFLSFVNEKRRKTQRELTMLEEFLRLSSSSNDMPAFEKPESIMAAASVIKKLLSCAATTPAHTLIIDFIKDAGIYRHILSEYNDNSLLRIRQLRAIGSFINMIKSSDLANPGIRLSELVSEMEMRKNHGIPIQGNLVTLTQAGVRVYTAHGSKGLEFSAVIIPFCLQDKSWPAKPIPEKIPLPYDLFKTKQSMRDRDSFKRLALQDETRLFYVAMTRAKSILIFTASPTEDDVPASYLDKLGLRDQPVPPKMTNEEELLIRSVESTDSKDPFIGTEEVLKDMVSNITLNPTRLNNYITCRRKFLYNDVLKLPGAKKKSLVGRFANHPYQFVGKVPAWARGQWPRAPAPPYDSSYTLKGLVVTPKAIIEDFSPTQPVSGELLNLLLQAHRVIFRLSG